MAELICFFQDYLSDLPPSEKRQILVEAETEILATPVEEHPEETLAPRHRQGQRPEGYLPLEVYRTLVEELRRVFARNAPAALWAFARQSTEAAQHLSDVSRKALRMIAEFPSEIGETLGSWALNPENWYLVSSSTSPFTLQSQISARFPCLVFENGLMECSTISEPDLRLDRLEDILEATGIYQLWKNGHLGRAGTVVVLDTGITPTLASSSKITASAAGSLSPTDTDGHGSAIAGLIRVLCPQANIESICVMKSFSGGQIWNLFAGLTQLRRRQSLVVNLSLGVTQEWIRQLGSSAEGFKEAISGVLGSLADNQSFPIAAAGNDGISDLRWPAASTDCLAVGSHSPGLRLSTFSNFRSDAQNLILAPGGDRRQIDGKIEAFGLYGSGLTRQVFGTSFSTAIASALACLLLEYLWFREMQAGSRISLFRNHCRRNDQGYPILNVADIGAVWPI